MAKEFIKIDELEKLVHGAMKNIGCVFNLLISF